MKTVSPSIVTVVVAVLQWMLFHTSKLSSQRREITQRALSTGEIRSQGIAIEGQYPKVAVGRVAEGAPEVADGPDQPSREKQIAAIKTFVEEAMAAGELLYFAADRVAIQSTITRWVKDGAEPGSKSDNKLHLLADFKPSLPVDLLCRALHRQREELRGLELVSKSSRWRDLKNEFPDRELAGKPGLRWQIGQYLLGFDELIYAGKYNYLDQLDPDYVHASKMRLGLIGSAIFGISLILLVGLVSLLLLLRSSDDSRHVLIESASRFEQKVKDVPDAIGESCTQTIRKSDPKMTSSSIAAICKNLSLDAARSIEEALKPAPSGPEVTIPAILPALPSEPGAPVLPACTGWIWIGRQETQYRNVGNPETLLPDRKLAETEGATVINLTDDLPIRERPPSASYDLGRRVGMLPRGGQVIVLDGLKAFDREFGNDRVRQYWRHVQAVRPENCATVYIQAPPTAKNSDAVRVLKTQLQANGYYTPGIEYIPESVGLYEIRFGSVERQRMQAGGLERLLMASWQKPPKLVPMKGVTSETAGIEIWVDPTVVGTRP